MKKFNLIPADVQQKMTEILETSENKSEALVQVLTQLNEIQHEELINTLILESKELEADRSRAKELGIRTSFTKEEKDFYNYLCAGARQAITADQIAVIPTTLIDRTLADVKAESDTLSLVNFAPAGVLNWVTGAVGSNCAAAWGTLTGALTAEITGAISALQINVHKLHAYCLIPKALRKLDMGIVDKYFRAILNEAMHDGIVKGYLDGDGLTAPIGILRKVGVGEVDSDGKHVAKTAVTTVTGFDAKNLAPVKKALSNGGKRRISEIHLICNPSDAAEYVDPSLYYFNGFGYVPTSLTRIVVHEEPMCPTGKGVFTIPDVYTMGFTGIEVAEYKETKALDDADLVVAKVLGNGRADDNNAAYVFDVTKVKPFVMETKTTTA